LHGTIFTEGRAARQAHREPWDLHPILKTGYKWVHRLAQAGVEGMADRSRRPQSSPRQTAKEIEELFVALRQRHADWGPRKLIRILVSATRGCVCRRVHTVPPSAEITDHCEQRNPCGAECNDHFAAATREIARASQD